MNSLTKLTKNARITRRTLKSLGFEVSNWIAPFKVLKSAREALEQRCMPSPGSRLTKNEMREILAANTESPIKVFIETGTFRAVNVVNLAPVFEQAHSIDLSLPIYRTAVKKFGDKTRFGINFHHGDSAVVLPRLLRDIQEPVVVYLDGHYCREQSMPTATGSFPLWKELKCIRERPYADIVIVDDVHTFGRKRPELEAMDRSNWEDVTTASILDALGQDRIDRHYVLRDEFIVHLSAKPKSPGGHDHDVTPSHRD